MREGGPPAGSWERWPKLLSGSAAHSSTHLLRSLCGDSIWNTKRCFSVAVAGIMMPLHPLPSGKGRIVFHHFCCCYYCFFVFIVREGSFRCINPPLLWESCEMQLLVCPKRTVNIHCWLRLPLLYGSSWIFGALLWCVQVRGKYFI